VIPAGGPSRTLRRRLSRLAVALRWARQGGLANTRPVDDNFGFGRGKPIDRYYIEGFLHSNAGDIRGRALEIGDASYCRQFGTGIDRQDVLHVHSDNPEATIIGDLANPGTLPPDAFDCLVLTQTLHLIYDMAAAVREVGEALKPGGVALLTVPGITPLDRHEWGGCWYWSLTEHSARHLFAENFPGTVEVETFGNVYAATSFLQGFALEDVRRARLDVRDAAYPVIVTIRAVREG